MKKCLHVLSILLIAILMLAISGCNEQMTDQVDRVIDTDTQPPTQQPSTPPVTEEPTVPTLDPLPDGTAVYVEPRQVT